MSEYDAIPTRPVTAEELEFIARGLLEAESPAPRCERMVGELLDRTHMVVPVVMPPRFLALRKVWWRLTRRRLPRFDRSRRPPEEHAAYLRSLEERDAKLPEYLRPTNPPYRKPEKP